MPTSRFVSHNVCPNCGSESVRSIPDATPGLLHCHCEDCNEVWTCDDPLPPNVVKAAETGEERYFTR